MTVLLVMIHETLPPTRNNIPYISRYFAGLACLVSFITAEAAVVRRIAANGEDDNAPSVGSFMSVVLASLCCLCHNRKEMPWLKIACVYDRVFLVVSILYMMVLTTWYVTSTIDPNYPVLL